jgi:hypothetical protein
MARPVVLIFALVSPLSSLSLSTGGIMLKVKKEVAPEWFDIQYEKLPYFCSSCGIMGHSHLECDKPLICNADGKLSYEDKPLRVQDTRKKKMQSFSDAAADTFGSAASSTSKYPSGSADVQKAARIGECTNDLGREEEEVSSPLKKVEPQGKGDTSSAGKTTTPANRQLFQAEKANPTRVPRKRKSKTANPSSDSSQTPNLNLPAVDSLAVVLTGLVSSRVNQLHGVRETPSSSPAA